MNDNVEDEVSRELADKNYHRFSPTTTKEIYKFYAKQDVKK